MTDQKLLRQTTNRIEKSNVLTRQLKSLYFDLYTQYHGYEPTPDKSVADMIGFCKAMEKHYVI